MPALFPKTSKDRKYNNSLLSTDFSNEESIVGVMENIWINRASIKYHLERQWYQNIAWYMGHQNLIWNNSAGALHEPRTPPWRVRLVVNHLQGMIRNLGSKLYRGAPEWDVLPATTDAMDLQTAQIQNQLLQANWYKMLMSEKSLENIMWTLICGNSFIEHVWDPDLGDPVVVPGEEGGVELDEDLAIGDTSASVVPPFEMLIDPRATAFRDAEWAMRSKLVNVDELKEDFDRAEGLTGQSSGSLSGFLPFQEHIKTLTSRGGNTTSTTGTYREDKNTVVVHTLWIPPRKKSKHGLKRGKMIVMAEGRVLNGGGKGVDFPYLHGELPYAHFYEVFVPGRIWGTSTLEQLLPMQANYNKTRSQLVESRNLMSKPKFFNPRGSGITGDSLTSEPGEIIDHNPGLRPEPMEAPNIPSYVQNMTIMDKQDMEDVSAVHGVSEGEAPGQVRGSQGVMALIEKNESRQAMVVQHFEQQMERLGRQNLSVSAQFVTEERMSKVVGENDELLLFAYHGNDLIGPSAGLPGVDYFDVRVRTTSGLPNSRAAQQELLTTLIEGGVLQPAKNPSDRRLVLKLFSVGNVVDHLDKARVHRSRQLQEIERIIQGENISAEQWHDHKVHLEILNEFRNSARYDTLPPEVKKQLETHAQQHKQWVAFNAVEPQIMARKAAMVAMVKEQMGQVGKAAQSEASNLLGGGQQGQSPQPRQLGQSPQAAGTPAQQQGVNNGEQENPSF